MPPPTSTSSTSSPAPNNPTTNTASARLSARGTANHTPHHSLSGISAAKAALSRSTTGTSNRRPTLISSSSNPSTSSPDQLRDELERERAKLNSIKADYDALLAAAEERETDANREANLWKTRATELAEQITRTEADLARFTETDDQLGRLTKELDRAKSLAKENERLLTEQNEEFDMARSAWADAEVELKARLASLAAEHAATQKAEMVDELSPPTPEDSEVGDIEFRRSPAFRQPALSPPTGPPALSTLQLEASLSEAKREATNAVADSDGLRRAITVLRDQLAEVQRLNQQLMEDNESYEFLVAERTLMGGFDIKQLLRLDDDDEEKPSVPPSASGSSLADVEEEDEDGDDAIERAVLEANGNGSRTTGAVEAEVSGHGQRSKAARTGDKAAGAGLGLDLAAELAQAEQSEELEIRRKDSEERKKKSSNGRANAKDKDAEIKFLTDANKALVLYISKILDRIQAHEGFEKVLATDYNKDGSPSRKTPATSTSASMGQTPGVTNLANSFLNVLTKSSSTSGGTAPDRKALNLANSTTVAAGTAAAAPQRTSWLQFFTASKSPPANAGIKPLKLGTTTGALGGSWQGVRDSATGDEDEEDVRERERLNAELKLHGIDKSAGHPGVQRSATLDGTTSASTRASRRGSSMYGAGSAASLIGKRMSAEAGMFSSSCPASPPAITPAAVLKRSEERERESRVNLEKGQASGFTEIEIRGSRLRPANQQRHSGTLSPNSTHSPGITSPTTPGVGWPSATTPTTGGIKDLKMASDLQPAGPAPEEGLLARTAKRISLMRS